MVKKSVETLAMFGFPTAWVMCTHILKVIQAENRDIFRRDEIEVNNDILETPLLISSL